MVERAEERILTVPLKKAYFRPRTKRAPYSIKLLKEFVRRHMKADEDEIIWIDMKVNEEIWKRGREKPPRRIRVRAKRIEMEGEESPIIEVTLAES